MMRFAYTLLLYLALPYAFGRLAWRALRQPGYLAHVGERFGRFPPRPEGPLIWVHAVSVGETRASEPLVRALRDKFPGHDILLTHMTPTGRETGERIFGGSVARCYLPYDYPGAVARFLDHYRPRAAIVMETEIWPNLIRACRARGIPFYLVNARLSAKSFDAYRRFGGFARATLKEITGVAAQSAEDAQRLKALGAPEARATGSLKFDVSPPAAQLALGAALRRAFGEARPVLLAASTRDGEEELLLDELPRIGVPGLLVVIVPRHPQRFAEVARLVRRRGLALQRRSEQAVVVPETQVVLGDSMGELFAYYAACDVAFVGGSLVPLGGQNLIEACAVGRPVLLGPHTYNFAEAAQGAVAAGAAIQVADAAALGREARRLLLDRATRERMSAAALAFAGVHRGATARILELIQLRNP